ncbi:MAG: DUF192 domain-containing protein [Candidatus Zambryskibacteria bacterium]|nr:DUF192 domain-containing protein [Candidatus Zambryskibacteria bacterium]
MAKRILELILLILVVIVVSFFFSVDFSRQNQTEINNPNQVRILKIRNQVLNIEIADTDIKKIIGLSNREDLKKEEALLFVFETPGLYSFWMKDMNFPIDIAWIDENKKIIHIESKVLPSTYPKIFVSNSPAKYVLETQAGFFEDSEIKIGDLAEF